MTLSFLLGAAVPEPAQVEQISLDYSAVGDCPSIRDFEEQVYARTQRVRFVTGSRSKRFFIVHLGNNSGVAVGRVTSGRDGEEGNAREVTSNSCSDVAAAIALVVALAIDPHASVGSIPESATSPAEPAAPPVNAPPVESSAIARNAAPPAQTAAPPAYTPAAAPAHALPTAPPAYAQTGPVAAWTAPAAPVNVQPNYWAIAPGGYVGDANRTKAEALRPIALSVGARLNGSLWWVPALVPFGAVAMSLQGESTSSTPLAAAFRLWVGYAGSSDVSTPTGASAHFAIASIQAEYCPARIAIAGGVHLRPCLGFAGGRLTGTGVASGSIAQAWNRHRPWGTIDESVHLQFALGKGWQTSLEAGLSEPLWHDTFVFELPGPGNATIATTPRLVPMLGLGVWLRFF